MWHSCFFFLRDILIVLGYFYAVIWCDWAGYEISIGPNGSETDPDSE